MTTSLRSIIVINLNHGVADTVVFGICVALIVAGALIMGPLMPTGSDKVMG